MKEVFHYSPPGETSANHEIVRLLDTEKTLLFTFEKAGLIKPATEISEPIDRMIDRASQPGEQTGEDNEFVKKRDIRSLESLTEDETVRNAVQQRITSLINERRGYSVDQTRALRNYGLWYSSKKGVPLVQEILKDMILRKKDSDLPRISPDAEDLAPDIVWMMIREDEESKKNTKSSDVG